MMMTCILRRCQGKRGCLCTAIEKAAFSKLQPIPTKSPIIVKSKDVELKPNPKQSILLPPIAANAKSKGNKDISSGIEKSSLVLTEGDKQGGEVTNNTETNELANFESKSDTNDASKSNGQVTIKFSHYKKQFQIVEGRLDPLVIDNEYCISFAYPRSKIHLTKYAPSDFSFEELGLKSAPLVAENSLGEFQNLEAGSEYYVVVEEDEVAKEEYEARQSKLASENAQKRLEQEKREAEGLEIVLPKVESCSCIEGNPCVDAYCCKDFPNRYTVAKSYGWKGFQ